MRSKLILCLVLAAACATASRGGNSSIKVGPPQGTLMVAGGGSFDREFWVKFVDAAGGAEKLIVVIPTAGGQPSYSQDDGGARAFRNAGAKNVLVLHTDSKAVANTDSFVAHIRQAGGVWFAGGRHFRLVDSYGGTKSEAAFHDVLARGGVVGGSSAGASIQGSFLVRGAPSNNNAIMAYPGYEKGFAFLRGVGIDQHVVARSRLPDLADSIMPKHPELLLISEDEGTAWVVQGDTGTIMGRSKAFVYNGKDATDRGKPFLTLWPGDRYNLATRRVISRAWDGSKLTRAFVDSLFQAVGSTPATVLVAQDGKVLINTSYNVVPQARYQPTTTVPNFDLGLISDALRREAFQAAGMAHTRVDSLTGKVRSNVDNLYRYELFSSGAETQRGSGGLAPVLPPWTLDNPFGTIRLAVYGTADGKRNAYVRLAPETTIIILTGSDAIDAKALAERIAARLLG